MNRNKLSWSERYADQPVNPQQAALWQAQTQPPTAGTERRPRGSETPGSTVFPVVRGAVGAVW